MVPWVTMTLPAAVSYDHDVRPILAANCFACHGPDGSTRKAKLRLDTEQTARPVLKDLLKRISHIDSSEHPCIVRRDSDTLFMQQGVVRWRRVSRQHMQGRSGNLSDTLGI